MQVRCCMQMGMYFDKIGPTTIAILVLLTLITIFALAIYDYMSNTGVGN